MYLQKNNFAVGYFKVLNHFTDLSQNHSRGAGGAEYGQCPYSTYYLLHSYKRQPQNISG